MEIPMNTLLDNLADHLQGDTLTQLSRQVGADEEATSNAIATALPLLVGGLVRNASTPAGASSLEQALDGDHDGSLLQNVSALFGAGNAAPVSPRTWSISSVPAGPRSSRISGKRPASTFSRPAS
jgi:hypothetical protein